MEYLTNSPTIPALAIRWHPAADGWPKPVRDADGRNVSAYGFDPDEDDALSAGDLKQMQRHRLLHDHQRDKTQLIDVLGRLHAPVHPNAKGRSGVLVVRADFATRYDADRDDFGANGDRRRGRQWKKGRDFSVLGAVAPETIGADRDGFLYQPKARQLYQVTNVKTAD